MVEWLAMMHVTPAVLSLNPTSVKLLFHNQKAFQEESCCSDNRMSKPDRNHPPNSDKLWAENEKVWRCVCGVLRINILTTQLAKLLCSEICLYNSTSCTPLVLSKQNVKTLNSSLHFSLSKRVQSKQIFCLSECSLSCNPHIRYVAERKSLTDSYGGIKVSSH